MVLTFAGTKGNYTVRESTEHASKGSMVASYAKIVMFSAGFCLLSVAYMALGSLTTSFNAELGSFSLATMFIGFTMTLFYAPSLMDMIGAKACAVCSGFCVLFYSMSYFHPTWFTLIPSSLVMGIGYGLLYVASGAIKNDEVQKCVERFKVDPVTYQGRFSAIIISFGLGTAACLSGSISFGILASTNLNHSRPNGSCVVSAINTSLMDNTSSTVHDSVVSLTVYYTLVATMTGVSLLCILTMSIMRGAVYHQCRVCSFKLKEALHNSATRTVKVFKQACTPAYGLVLPLRMNQGFVIAYFAGVFTKRFVTECIGVQYVGVALSVHGTCATLGSFGSGWLMRYTTSYMMVLVCIGGLEVGSLVFLIVWERQPSFAVIILIPAIFGLCYGVNATVALAYSGTAPGDNVTGYSALVVEHTVVQAIQFFVSEYISTEANLFVILVITILAVPLFTIADTHYGSGTSRNICGKKKPTVHIGDSTQSESDGGRNGEDGLGITKLVAERPFEGMQKEYRQ